MTEDVYKKTAQQKLEAKRESCRKSQAKNMDHIRAVWKAREEKYKAELAVIKAKRPKKKRMTIEEQRQKTKDLRDDEAKREKEFKKKTYMPPNRTKVMEEIRKIYRRGGIEELADRVGISEHYFISWMNSDSYKPSGGYLKDLQEYFAEH